MINEINRHLKYVPRNERFYEKQPNDLILPEPKNKALKEAIANLQCMYGEEVDFNMDEQTVQKQPTRPATETLTKPECTTKNLKRRLKKKIENNEVWAGPGGKNAWIFQNLTDDGKYHYRV